MVTEDQSAVIAYLSRPDTYGSACPPVERIDTHSAMVFLAGARALKMKRAVRYDYLDFSTAERRRRCCEAELALNRRTAPDIYRRIAVVARDADGRLTLDGAGTPVEWLVDMRRFDQDALCDRLASRGDLPLQSMPTLAAAIVALHEPAERRFDFGGSAGMQWVVDGNMASFDEFGDVFPADARADLRHRTAAELTRASPLLDQRRDRGFVRQCHGDLHLRNIVLLDGMPTLFDAVEFNDAIACTDVFYDLAFLLMDLWRRRLWWHANLVLNEYVRRTADREGLALLPLFLSCRAAVRAKTSATAATLADDARSARELNETARGYMRLARSFLEPAPASLTAIGGASGSGKSTVAARVAPFVGRAPGALHVRSDVIRKTLLGVDPLTRLPASAYAPDTSARVYAEMRRMASEALSTGHSVICDAVYASRAERDLIASVAAKAEVPLVTVWLQAADETLLSRVRTRLADASDATEEVVRGQLQQGADAPEWTHLSAEGDAAQASDRVLHLLSSTSLLGPGRHHDDRG
jgi:aminoglycoside phosphotransferase family enzyme/predicted kinase